MGCGSGSGIIRTEYRLYVFRDGDCSISFHLKLVDAYAAYALASSIV